MRLKQLAFDITFTMPEKCSDIMLARFSAKILPGAQQELRNGVLPWHKVEIFEVLLISEKMVM